MAGVFTWSPYIHDLLDKDKDLSFGDGVGSRDVGTKDSRCCLGVISLFYRLPFLAIKKMAVFCLSQGANVFCR
jgi:hypothetical protein